MVKKKFSVGTWVEFKTNDEILKGFIVSNDLSRYDYVVEVPERRNFRWPVLAKEIIKVYDTHRDAYDRAMKGIV